MTPPLDLDSLRRQYPEMPGWGERVFLELHAIKETVSRTATWTPKDISIIAGTVTAVVVALKGGGAL